MVENKAKIRYLEYSEGFLAISQEIALPTKEAYVRDSSNLCSIIFSKL